MTKTNANFLLILICTSWIFGCDQEAIDNRSKDKETTKEHSSGEFSLGETRCCSGARVVPKVQNLLCSLPGCPCENTESRDDNYDVTRVAQCMQSLQCYKNGNVTNADILAALKFNQSVRFECTDSTESGQPFRPPHGYRCIASIGFFGAWCSIRLGDSPPTLECADISGDCGGNPMGFDFSEAMCNASAGNRLPAYGREQGSNCKDCHTPKGGRCVGSPINPGYDFFSDLRCPITPNKKTPLIPKGQLCQNLLASMQSSSTPAQQKADATALYDTLGCFSPLYQVIVNPNDNSTRDRRDMSLNIVTDMTFVERLSFGYLYRIPDNVRNGSYRGKKYTITFKDNPLGEMQKVSHSCDSAPPGWSHTKSGDSCIVELLNPSAMTTDDTSFNATVNLQLKPNLGEPTCQTFVDLNARNYAAPGNFGTEYGMYWSVGVCEKPETKRANQIYSCAEGFVNAGTREATRKGETFKILDANTSPGCYKGSGIFRDCSPGQISPDGKTCKINDNQCASSVYAEYSCISSADKVDVFLNARNSAGGNEYGSGYGVNGTRENCLKPSTSRGFATHSCSTATSQGDVFVIDDQNASPSCYKGSGIFRDCSPGQISADRRTCTINNNRAAELVIAEFSCNNATPTPTPPPVVTCNNVLVDINATGSTDFGANYGVNWSNNARRCLKPDAKRNAQGYSCFGTGVDPNLSRALSGDEFIIEDAASTPACYANTGKFLMCQGSMNGGVVQGTKSNNDRNCKLPAGVCPSLIAAQFQCAQANNGFDLTVTRSGTGSGTVTSSVAGINCPSDCSENYTSGTSVTLTAVPSSGSTFGGWGEACSGTGTCTVSMTAAKLVIANFNTTNGSSFSLTVGKNGTGSGTIRSSDSRIDCGGTCSSNYNSGASVTLTASAGTNSTFAGWSGSCSGMGACSLSMNANHNVNGTFNSTSSTQQTLNVNKAGTGSGTVTSSPGGINCGSDCSEPYNSNTSVTLTAAAASGSTFAGWSGACTGTSTCAVTMSQQRTVTASFNSAANTTHRLTISRLGTGTGTVNASPGGTSCGADCRDYSAGTVVTLTATANAGATFAGWGDACSGTGTCTVTMSQARNVTATFNASTTQYRLTVNLAGTGIGTVTSNDGGINCGLDCDQYYNSVTMVTLTATAAPGSVFNSWNGACSGMGVCTVTMSAAKTVTAVFNRSTASQYLLTVNKTGSGSGTVTSNPGINCGNDCSENYAAGTYVILQATPASGSVFVGWSGGVCSGTGGCGTTMTSAKTVTARFDRAIGSQ